MNIPVICGTFISDPYLQAINALVNTWEYSLFMREINITADDMYDIINMLDGCFFE